MTTIKHSATSYTTLVLATHIHIHMVNLNIHTQCQIWCTRAKRERHCVCGCMWAWLCSLYDSNLSDRPGMTNYSDWLLIHWWCPSVWVCVIRYLRSDSQLVCLHSCILDLCALCDLLMETLFYHLLLFPPVYTVTGLCLITWCDLFW